MAKTDGNALEARIAALEAENAALRSGIEQSNAGNTDAAASASRARARRGWGRTLTAVVLIVVGLLLAPVAVISAWARLELADTDRFVATFAPLAEDPAVQAYLSDQVTAAIEEQVDIPALTGELFDGIRTLGLPPKADAALGLLEGPATQGIQSLVSDVVDRAVQSPAFADIWASTLRITHRQFVAAMQNDPDAALAIGEDGTISVQLGPIVENVKQRLIDQGVGFAQAIPAVDRSIVIAKDDAFALIRTIYAIAIGVGTWLPWIMLAMLVIGVVVARNRVKALVWTAGGFVLSMVVLASGVGIGRWYFVGAVSPAIMPASAAEAIYSGLIEIMMSTIVALIVLGALVAVVAWFSGPWRPARALRGFAESGFAAVRRAAAAHGITTGRFGIGLDRWRVVVYVAIAVIASLVVLFARPVSAGLVITTLLLALLALLIVELLRRPEAETAGEVPAAEADAAADAEALVVAGTDGDVDVVVVEAARGESDTPSRSEPARPAD